MASQEKDNTASNYKPDAQANDLAKAGLSLLEHLISGSKKDNIDDFRLNLFETDEDETAAEAEYAKIRLSREVLIDGTKGGRSKEISQLINEFTIESNVGND